MGVFCKVPRMVGGARKPDTSNSERCQRSYIHVV